MTTPTPSNDRTLTARPLPWAAAPLCLVALLACACLQRQHAADLPYRTGTIEHHANGQMRKGRLVEPTTLADLPAAHWVHFHEDGTPKGFRLAENATVAGHRLPKETYLWFDERGQLQSAWLSRDLEIDGVQCNGGPGKIATYFHPNGRLKTAFLVANAVIQGVPCKASVFHPVRFDENSKLVGCTLSRDASIAGVHRERGERVTIP